VTYTTTSFADSFLATGSPTNPGGTDLTGLNYGAAGHIHNMTKKATTINNPQSGMK